MLSVLFVAAAPDGVTRPPRVAVHTIHQCTAPVADNDENFWWVFAPPNDAQNVVGSRTIKPHQFGRFRVQADALPSQKVTIGIMGLNRGMQVAAALENQPGVIIRNL